mgnify:FL=1
MAPLPEVKAAGEDATTDVKKRLPVLMQKVKLLSCNFLTCY